MDEIFLHFPYCGMDVSKAFCKQPNRPYKDGKYARTTVRGVNVRAVDADGRYRGAIRPGLSKFTDALPGDEEYVSQMLDVLVTTSEDPMQPSQSGRLVMVVVVSQGNVYVLPAGETTWLTPTNNTGQTPALNATGIVYSANNNQLMFFADGINPVYYDPITNVVETWTLTAGTFPEDADGNLPRLICTWRGRTVLSGLFLDPAVLFMSKVSDPFDFNYAPDVPVPADAAWSGQVGPQGLTGDVVTALIPYTDDILIIGMDSSIAIFRGDPMAGGQIDLVTNSIGIAWGMAYCMDPTGVVYFFSNRCGIYGFVPGNQPQRISQPIDPLLRGIDTGEYAIRLMWNDTYKGLHVFVTLLATPQETTHYFWESQANAWWQDTFTDTDMNPLTCCVFDGNLQDDRVCLIGSWDGYVRALTPDSTNDDGVDIESEVWLGPALTPIGDDVRVDEIQAVMASDSGDVLYAVYTGETAEEALEATPFPTGQWSAGRNYTNLVRRAAHAVYVQMSASVLWAMESVRVKLGSTGMVRRRGKQ